VIVPEVPKVSSEGEKVSCVSSELLYPLLHVGRTRLASKEELDNLSVVQDPNEIVSSEARVGLGQVDYHEVIVNVIDRVFLVLYGCGKSRNVFLSDHHKIGLGDTFPMALLCGFHSEHHLDEAGLLEILRHGLDVSQCSVFVFVARFGTIYLFGKHVFLDFEADAPSFRLGEKVSSEEPARHRFFVCGFSITNSMFGVWVSRWENTFTHSFHGGSGTTGGPLG
jgi:hypothetical protein